MICPHCLQFIADKHQAVNVDLVITGGGCSQHCYCIYQPMTTAANAHRQCCKCGDRIAA